MGINAPWMSDLRAALLGLGILLIGFGGYTLLPEPWGGLSLVVAGVALVLLGLGLDRPVARVPMPSSEAGGAEAVATRVRTEGETTEPIPTVAATEDARTLDLGRTQREPATTPVTPAVPEPNADVGHQHEDPLVGHSELVDHMRDQHRDVSYEGSTLQLRLVHERAHAG